MTFKELREKVGTQEEFGELIGVDRTTVLKWEKGKSTPTAKTIGKIAEVLNMTESEVYAALRNKVSKRKSKRGVTFEWTEESYSGYGNTPSWQDRSLDLSADDITEAVAHIMAEHAIWGNSPEVKEKQKVFEADYLDVLDEGVERGWIDIDKLADKYEDEIIQYYQDYIK